MRALRSKLMILGLVLVPAMMLSSCTTRIQDYKEETPALHLDEFFQGKLEAYGMVQDFRGKVTRRFKAEIVGNWDNGTGILDERFVYDAGEVQFRCWRLQKSGNQYTGTAFDVVGEASGQTAGNALNWQYKLEVPVDGKPIKLALNDWLYLIDENHLINRATMTYWGIPVGEITLYIEKLDSAIHAPLAADCIL